MQSQKDMERKFAEYFADFTSEWIPCNDDDGNRRVFWDQEVGAHDVEVNVPEVNVRCPERVRLRSLLDRVLGSEGPVDLRPVRRFMAALCQTSARHTLHGEEKPVMGKHACFQGTPQNPQCRYGHPHQHVRRGGSRPMKLEKGDREGSWFARFARNDKLFCSIEPHLLADNCGNIDFRPCLNLWSVVSYVTKYATKAPKGSKRLGDVLQCAVDEVCKYEPEGEGVDLLRRSLQKVYARTLGDRDFGIFEAVHLGLRLPLVIPLLPCVSLSTLGTRTLRQAKDVHQGADEAPVTWDSKIDKFDNRKALAQKVRRRGQSSVSAEEVRDVSLYEFYCKFRFSRGHLVRSAEQVCLMVTPSFSADCASVLSARHAEYARSCVVAFWRLMPTEERLSKLRDRRLLSSVVQGRDPPEWGASTFTQPADRYLGVQDLVHKFDTPRRDSDGLELGWSMGLMEMLVDPLLCLWTPDWVVEQYERWNRYFRPTLRREKVRAEQQQWTNRKLLKVVRQRMIAKQKRKQAQVDEACGGSDGGLDSEDDKPPPVSSEEEVDAQAVVAQAEGEVEMVRDARPSADGFDPGVAGDEWARRTAEQELSAAPPAPAAADLNMLSGLLHGASDDCSRVNPPGYHWQSAVNLDEMRRVEADWKRWRGTSVARSGDGVARDQLDEWGKFAFDIVMDHARRHDARASVFRQRPLRLVLTGGAGSGKSTTVRAMVRHVKELVRGHGHHAVRTADDACILAAPTGCASFQMKYGATTAHRAWSVPVGYCGPLSRHGHAFSRLRDMVKAARLAVFDEFSMLGRVFIGKILYRAA
ncbi:MAG: AAA family ATPase, partial [Halioglobus sp.]